MGLVVIFGAQGLGNLMAGVVQLGEAEVLRNTLQGVGGAECVLVVLLLQGALQQLEGLVRQEFQDEFLH